MGAEVTEGMILSRTFNRLHGALGNKASLQHVAILINVASEHDGGGITLAALAKRLNLSQASVRGLLRALAPNDLSPIQQNGSLAGLVQTATSDNGQPDVLVMTVRGGLLMQQFAHDIYSNSASENNPNAKKNWAGEDLIRTL